jgi:hypothetical protein
VARQGGSREGQRYRPREIDRQVAAARQGGSSPASATTQRTTDRRQAGTAALARYDGTGGGTQGTVRDRNGRSNYNSASWRPPVKQYTAGQRTPVGETSNTVRASRDRVLNNTRQARPVSGTPALSAREPVSQAAAGRSVARQLRRDDNANQSRPVTRQAAPVQSRESVRNLERNDTRRQVQSRQSTPVRSATPAPRETRQAAPTRERSERQAERKSAPAKTQKRESASKDRGGKQRERRK